MKTLQFDHMLGDFASIKKARTLYPSDFSRIYSCVRENESESDTKCN